MPQAGEVNTNLFLEGSIFRTFSRPSLALDKNNTTIKSGAFYVAFQVKNK